MVIYFASIVCSLLFVNLIATGAQQEHRPFFSRHVSYITLMGHTRSRVHYIYHIDDMTCALPIDEARAISFSSIAELRNAKWVGISTDSLMAVVSSSAVRPDANSETDAVANTFVKDDLNTDEVVCTSSICEPTTPQLELRICGTSHSTRMEQTYYCDTIKAGTLLAGCPVESGNLWGYVVYPKKSVYSYYLIEPTVLKLYKKHTSVRCMVWYSTDEWAAINDNDFPNMFSSAALMPRLLSDDAELPDILSRFTADCVAAQVELPLDTAVNVLDLLRDQTCKLPDDVMSDFTVNWNAHNLDNERAKRLRTAFAAYEFAISHDVAKLPNITDKDVYESWEALYMLATNLLDDGVDPKFVLDTISSPLNMSQDEPEIVRLITACKIRLESVALRQVIATHLSKSCCAYDYVLVCGLLIKSKNLQLAYEVAKMLLDKFPDNALVADKLLAVLALGVKKGQISVHDADCARIVGGVLAEFGADPTIRQHAQKLLDYLEP